MKTQYAVALTVGIALAACASEAPVAQIRAFSDAFKLANEAGQPLIDDLAIAERQVGQVNAVSRAKGKSEPIPTGKGCVSGEATWQELPNGTGFIRGFCLADAPYFANVGDPPSARAFRDAMSVVQQYDDVLLLLAEGRNIPEVQAQIQTLGNNVGSLIAFIPGAQPYVAAIGPVLDALKPIIAAAAQQANNKEVVRLLVQGSPKVKELLDKLQEGAGAMFANLTDAAARHATSAEVRRNPDLAKPDIDRMETYRVSVSNYVYLLDGLKSALDDAVAAAEKPASPATLAALTERSSQLVAQAEAVRRTWSALRSGMPPNQ